MKYSVVMPCLLKREEHRQTVLDTIASVKANSEDYEFIIVDDGSTLSSGFLKSAADTYIRHDRSRGIAPSWNDGKNVSRGDYIAIINDDIKVPEGWLDKMQEGFSDEESGVVGVQKAGPQVIPEILGNEFEIDYKWFSGYCFMLERGTFWGDFDEQFVPFNFEDIDYWERVLASGLTCIKAPVAIWHAEGDTIHSMRYEEVDNKNLKRFIAKWGFNPKSKYFS